MSPLPAGECVCGKSSMNQSKMGPIPRQTKIKIQNKRSITTCYYFAFSPDFLLAIKILLGNFKELNQLKIIKNEKINLKVLIGYSLHQHATCNMNTNQ